MYYVNCAQCGRLVMSHNVCAYCQTLDRSQRPRSNLVGASRSQSASPGAIALLAGLAAAGFAYWKTADETIAAVVAVLIWAFAKTSVGQTLAKVAVAVAGLGLAWLVLTFFTELSKTYR